MDAAAFSPVGGEKTDNGTAARRGGGPVDRDPENEFRNRGEKVAARGEARKAESEREPASLGNHRELPLGIFHGHRSESDCVDNHP